MDPKKLAEDIMEQLLAEAQQENYDSDENEEEEEEEGDDENEEYDSEESEEDSEEECEDCDQDYEGQSSQSSGNASKNQASIQMKPSMASAAQTGGTVSQGDADLSGRGSRDAFGRGFVEMPSDTQANAQANQSTLQMKPVDFTGIQLPTLNREKLTEDIKILFGGDGELSESFLNKAISLYEASILTNIQGVTQELTEQFQDKLIEQVDEVRQVLEEQVDQYLSYVVEEWMQENALAVENGIRTEIAEEFISNLKGLFEQSYISVPDDKVDAFEALTSSVENIELELNEQVQKNMQLKEHIDALTALNVFNEETKSLNTLDVEKVKKLIENVEYENQDDFRDKVQVIVEGYVRNKTSAKTSSKISQIIEHVQNDLEIAEDVQPINETISLYSNVLNRTING